ncbi:hypothetical protein [Prevotella histicola]
MNLYARRAEGTREEKTEKRDLSCTIPKGTCQEQPANDHKENVKALTKLPRSRKKGKESKRIKTEKHTRRHSK